MKPTKRNPAGVDVRRPIALRLMPAERIDAERVAARLNVSLSKLARMAYLRGLPYTTAAQEKTLANES